MSGALEASPEARLIDLLSDAGELASEPLKHTDYGRGACRPGED